MPHRPRLLFPLLASLAMGCAPALSVTRVTHPGEDLGGARHLAVVEVRGQTQWAAFRDVAARVYGPHPLGGSTFLPSDLPEQALAQAADKLVSSLAEGAEPVIERVAVPLVQAEELAEANDSVVKGDAVKAERLLRALLERQPDHVGAMFNLGLIAESRDDLEAASGWYARAVAAAPLRADFREAVAAVRATRAEKLARSRR